VTRRGAARLNESRIHSSTRGASSIRKPVCTTTGARFYDQNVGRFLFRRQRPKRPRICYVGNNPGVFVDPSGLVARLYCDLIPTGRGPTFWGQGLACNSQSNPLLSICFVRRSCYPIPEPFDLDNSGRHPSALRWP